MAFTAVPYHLDERLHGFVPGVPVEREIIAELPPGGAWQRMGVLYEQVAQAVAGWGKPGAVVSGDCTTSLGVLAGLQRGGHEVGIVWFDAHADFHTDDSTVSGYLGGMPLALATGIGTPALPEALGLHPVAASQILLVDARDTDPGEQPLLEQAAVRRRPVGDLDAAVPQGELYLHIDVDVCDAGEVPGLLYPAPHGPTTAAVLNAVRQVVATGRVAAVGVAATWRHHSRLEPAQLALMQQLHESTIGGPSASPDIALRRP